MSLHLTEIKQLHKVAIASYRTAAAICKQPNLKKFFQSYYFRRSALLANIYNINPAEPEELNFEFYELMSLEVLIDKAIANENQLIEAYNRQCESTEDDRLIRTLRLHKTELEIAYKNMLVIIPFYSSYKLAAEHRNSFPNAEMQLINHN